MATEKKSTKREDAEATMRAMRKQYPLGTCGICHKQNARIVGRLASEVAIRVCGECYGDRIRPQMVLPL